MSKRNKIKRAWHLFHQSSFVLTSLHKSLQPGELPTKESCYKSEKYVLEVKNFMDHGRFEVSTYLNSGRKGTYDSIWVQPMNA